MNKSIIALSCALGSVFALSVASAQETDATETLPDAKPGECYAKVITPAKFATRSEDVVVQDASERIETVPARYETVDQTFVVKESSRSLSVSPATYAEEFEKVEIRPAETSWVVSGSGKNAMPASPGALEGISRSGVNLSSVTAGSCFREYFAEPEYRVDTQQVLVKEASEKVTINAAVYETVEERVVVKEASSRIVDVPATYRSETESVLVEPARSVWKKGRGPIERIDNTTGEIMCLVEVPARYETITKTVLETPATTKKVDVPAIYKTIKVQRLVSPATESREVLPAEFESVSVRTKIADAGFFWLKKGETANSDAQYSGREVCLVGRDAEYTTIKRQVVKSAPTVIATEVPAEYSTVKIQRLVSPATENRTAVPARTKTVTRQVQIEPSKLEWRRILCETNMTPKLVASIQRALKREGYDPGPIDGVVGRDTLDAIEAFQLKENLDRGGLTYQTLKALKVQS